MGIRTLAGVTGSLLLVVAIGCGGSSSPAASQATGSAPPAPGASASAGGPVAATSCSADAASGAQISMEGTHTLNPPDQTISVGGTVSWTNKSSTNHQIVFENGPKCAITLIGKVTTIKFDTPGSFAYVCIIHADFMKGTITVQ